MTKWVAIAYGALDVIDDPPVPGGEVLAVPVIPAPPRSLFGQGAALWRRLVSAGPLDDADLDDTEASILAEMLELGLASNDEGHEARVRVLNKPWLESPLHELVYALVAEVARGHRIECVFIKGPVLQLQGLRDRAHSGDVDLWVEPGKQLELLGALRRWGWSAVPFDFAEEMYHSITLEPVDWGCEIDVHFRFPGIGAEPGDAFRELMNEREEVTFAGVGCPVPSRAASAVIQALHNLRPDPKVILSQQARAESQTGLRLGGADALRLATEWQALAVLASEFSAALPDLTLPPHSATVPRDWIQRGAPSVARYHIAVIKSLPWYRRPAAAWHVLWPSGRTAKLSATRQGHPDDSVLVAHLRRLGLGFSQLFKRR